MENKSLAGTKTEQNLLKAFAGESQARNRYEFFSKQAKSEGFVQISNIFAYTAEQERSHAKSFFKFLEGGELEITAQYSAGKVGTTEENLRAAAEGENEEWSKLYPEFSAIAKEEGFPKIAAIFKLIAKVEAEHEKRFRALLKNVEEGSVFRKNEKVDWECVHCGYVHHGEEAPDMCPACSHAKAYFEVKPTNY